MLSIDPLLIVVIAAVCLASIMALFSPRGR